MTTEEAGEKIIQIGEETAMTNREYGDKLIKLGKLLKNDSTKMKDLVAAAHACGLAYSFSLVPAPEEPS